MRSRQKGRIPSVAANAFMGIGWGYLLLIPVWYDATKLWLLPEIPIIGLLATNEIFPILMLLGFVFPLIYAVWLLFVYFNVRKYSSG
ncbi:MAG: hypothetical protein ACFFE8_10970 [Candidatus Heimdallarchaeota archaeon]